MPETYKCDRCGGTVETTSNEKANAEAEALRGIKRASERDDIMVRVCDKCFDEFLAWYRQGASA